MTYQSATLLPTSLKSAGTGVTLTGGSLPTILADGSDATYVDFASGCRNPNQVLQLGFGPLTLPVGAQIQSVTLIERDFTVTAATAPPQCYFGLCTNDSPDVFLLTSALNILKLAWFAPHPQTTTGQWVNQTIRSSKTAADGTPWTVADFASNFYLEIGRTDLLAASRRVSQVSLVINYNVAATLTATGPTSPVTTTSTPTITWTFVNNTDGLPQKASRVVIYTAAQVAAVGFVAGTSPGYADSGWVLGQQTQWIVDTPLPNGSYTAYVFATQTWDGPTEFHTNSSSITWTQSITACPNAVLSTTGWDPATNTVPLTAVPASSSPSTDFFRFVVSRNGAKYEPVFGAAAVPANGMTPVTIVDNEAPSNLPSTYQVLSFKMVGGVAQPAAAYSNTVSVTPTVSGGVWWLKDRLNYLSNTKLPVFYEGDQVTQSKSFGVAYVLGTDADTVYPVVTENGRYGTEGTLTVMFVHSRAGDAQWAAFDALDLIGRTLILCDPSGGVRYVRLVPGQNGQAKTWKWELTAANGVQYRKGTTPYVEVSGA